MPSNANVFFFLFCPIQNGRASHDAGADHENRRANGKIKVFLYGKIKITLFLYGDIVAKMHKKQNIFLYFLQFFWLFANVIVSCWHASLRP